MKFLKFIYFLHIIICIHVVRCLRVLVYIYKPNIMYNVILPIICQNNYKIKIIFKTIDKFENVKGTIYFFIQLKSSLQFKDKRYT